jgi:hypothetical protein
MLNYEMRRPNRSHAPDMFLKLNTKLMAGGTSPMRVKSVIELFRDSWAGVTGHFKDDKVKVDQAFVSDNGINTGVLGALKVVEVSLQRPDTPTYWPYKYDLSEYEGFAVVAELTDTGLWGRVKGVGQIAISTPWITSWDTAAHKAVFERVRP